MEVRSGYLAPVDSATYIEGAGAVAAKETAEGNVSAPMGTAEATTTQAGSAAINGTNSLMTAPAPPSTLPSSDEIKDDDQKQTKTAEAPTPSKERVSTKSSRPRSTYISSLLRDVVDSASQKIRGALSNKASSRTSSPDNSSKMKRAIRTFDSQRKPALDMNSLHIDKAEGDLMTAEALEHARRTKRKRENRIETALRYVSVFTLFFGALIGTAGWVRYFLAHWELSALEAAEQQTLLPWKEDCERNVVYRELNGMREELTCKAMMKLKDAKWSEWSECFGGWKNDEQWGIRTGKRYRWKIVEPNVSYETAEAETFESEACDEGGDDSTAMLSSNETTTSVNGTTATALSSNETTTANSHSTARISSSSASITPSSTKSLSSSTTTTSASTEKTSTLP